MKERELVEYFYKGDFLFRLGRVSYTEAKHPMGTHDHGSCTELVFLIKGRQQYLAEGVSYSVSGGEVFTAFPGEAHSTGENPEEKALFYYLIIDLQKAVCGDYLCMEHEKENVLRTLSNPQKRIRKSKDWYGKICEGLMELCQGEAPGKDTKIRNLLSILLLDLADGQEEAAAKDESVEPALSYIQSHVKEAVKIETLAELTGLSVSRFKHCFAKKTGIPPREYILRKKLEYCKRELEVAEKSVTEIAYEYGFSSSQYFSTVFKRYCFISPADFQRKNRGKTS